MKNDAEWVLGFLERVTQNRPSSMPMPSLQEAREWIASDKDPRATLDQLVSLVRVLGTMVPAKIARATVIPSMVLIFGKLHNTICQDSSLDPKTKEEVKELNRLVKRVAETWEKEMEGIDAVMLTNFPLPEVN